MKKSSNEFSSHFPKSSWDRIRQNSAEHFEKTGKFGYPNRDDLRRAQIDRVVGKEPFLKNLTKPEFAPAQAGLSVMIEQGVSGLKHGAGELLVHGIDKAVPGIGHYYLMPKLAAIDLSVGVYNRTNNALAEGKPTGEAFTCGVVGSVAQTGTSLIGNTLVTGAATAVVLKSGGTMFIPATGAAAAGYVGVGILSSQVGNATEKACHATFDMGRKVDEKLKQMDFKSLFKTNSNSVTTTPSFSNR